MNRDILTASINLSIARAAWWTAHARTSANLSRTVHHGGHDGALLTADELVNSAMDIADTHLTRAQEALEQLNVLP